MRFVLLAVVLVVFAADATSAAAAPALFAGVGVRAAQGQPLRAQVLTGRTDVWVTGVGKARFALLGVDRRPATRGAKRIRLTLRGGALRPWAFDTAKLRDGAHVLQALVIRRGGRPVRLRAAFRVDNHGARTDQLIARALARHQIDLGTSLVYRFYAFLGDPRLPLGLRGAPPADDSVAMDARAALTAGTVKGKEARRLSAYLLRPTDPRSPLHVGGGTRARRAAASSGCGSNETAPEIGVGDGRVWAWQDSRDAFPRAYRWVQSYASKALAREEGDMGPAAPDGPADCAAANPSNATDVYLVNGPATTVSRTSKTTGAGNLAVTVPDRCANGTCSGFVLLNVRATTLKRTAVDSTLVHELFHVLEFARLSAWPAQWPWPTEADATWAQGHYEPGNPDAARFSQNQYAWYQYDKPFRSLGQRCGGCEYQYWIWPFFMTQEGASVAQSWKAVAGAQTDREVNQRLNSYFPYADHLRDFAIRDLNLDYHEKGGADGRRFQTGAGGWSAIPALATPRRGEWTPIKLQDTQNQKRALSVVSPISLDFESQAFALPAKDKLRFVSMDFSALGPHFDVDVLVHVAGQSGYEHRRVNGQTFTFCRDDSGDDIDSIIAVYTDHTLEGELGQTINMNYRGRTSCSPVTEWKGPLSSRENTAKNGVYETSSVTANADYVLDRANSTSTWWNYVMTPTTAEVKVSGHQDGGCSWTGSGTVRMTGNLEVIDPHSDHGSYGPSASTGDDTIPVHYTCPLQSGGTYTYTQDTSHYDNFFGRASFSDRQSELADSYDSGSTSDPRRVNTWDFTAAATGDAP